MNSGFKVFFDMSLYHDSAKRISISSGVRKITVDGRYSYWVSNEDWAPLSDEVKSSIISESYNDKRCGVVIKKLDDKLFSNYEVFRSKIINATDFEKNSSLLLNTNLMVFEHFKSLSSGRFQYTLLPIFYRDAGCISTSYIDHLDQFVGLHIDSFHYPFVEDKLHEEKSNFNRLCINVGNESRSFLFSRYSVREMLELLGESASSYLTPQNLVSTFFERFPNTEIYKILLNPGEMYFAKTEFFIHDGSTIGRNQIDVTTNIIADLVLKPD